MKTTQATAPSTKRSMPHRIRRDAEPHRIEPLEARIAPAIVFTPSTPVAPTVNSTDVGLGTLGGFSPIEPMISVNDTDPGNVAVSSHRGIRVSIDGTANFAATQLFAQPPGATGLSGDTDTAFDAEGRLFWTNLVNFPGRRDVGVTEVNPTTGAVIGTATTAPNGGFGDDKQMLTADADPFGLSPYRNNLYTSFSRFGVTPGEWEVFVSRSTNQAGTWSAPLQLSNFATEGFTWPSDVAAAPDGDVFLAYHSQPDINDAELEGGTPANPNGTSGQIFVLRSTDGGVTFPQKTLAFGPGQADVTFNRQDAPGGNIAGTRWWSVGSAQPWVLVDPAREGHIYVIAADDPNNIHGNGDEGNIVISRSFNDGLTWSQSTVSAPAGNSFQLFPSASIDLFGNIAVAWYDNRRALTNGGGNFLLDVFATYSVDGGATWAPDFRVNDNALDPDIGAVNRFAGPPATTRIGEYFGLDLYGGTAYLAWNGQSPTTGGQTGQQVLFDTFSIAGSVSVAGDENGGSTDDTFTVRRVAGSTDLVEILVNGDRQYSGLLSSLDHLDVAGLGGNDTLIVDSSNGLLNFPGGIRFDGGAGVDKLTLQQTGGAIHTSDTYSVGPNNGDGSSVIVGGGLTQKVQFQNIEPASDNVPAASLIVNGTPADNALNYTAGPGGGIFVGNTGKVTIDNFESIEFNNKTALTINALAGDDTISLNNPGNPAGLTGITITGGDPTASDILVINGTGGVDTVAFTPTSANSGSLTGLATPVTFNTTEHVVYDANDLGGVDVVTINGTLTNDAFNFDAGILEGSFRSFSSPDFDTVRSGRINVNGGGNGSDVVNLVGSAGVDTITSAASAISVATPGSTAIVTLGAGVDVVTVTTLAGNDSIDLSGVLAPITASVYAGDDNDTIIGSPQADLLVGGAGNDILVGGAGVDQEYGEDGNDIFGNATLTSNGVADDAGADFAFGGPGFDNFVWEPGDGADFNNGGEDGADIFRFFGDANANVFTLRPGGTPTHINALIGAVNIDNHGVEDVVVDGQGGADSFTVNDLFTTEVVSVNLVMGSADAAVDAVIVNGRALSDQLLIATPAAAAVRVSGLRYNVNLTTVEPTDTLTLNGNEGDDELKAVDGIEALIAITLDGGQGNDTLSADALLLGGIGNDILTGGLGNDSFDGGAGTDRVVAAGDVNFTLTNTTLTGLGADTLTAIEEVQLTGGTSANTFNVGAYTGRLFLTGDDGADTIDFSTAPGSVIFDLDLVNSSQAVTGAGLKVTLGDVIENFTGSAFNDLLFADAAIFARVFNGGPQTVVPPGDKLSFDGRGQVVTVLPVDANTGTIKTRTLADSAYDEFETVVITNSPSGGGFGPPGSNSNAFTDAHIYDPTTFTIAGKPAAGRGPNSVATGDLNGDGFADMVSANGKTKNVSVFLNKGDGTFGEPTNFISASGPQDLVLVDFNGDTDLDLAVTNRLAGNVAIFIGNGAGGFAAPTLIKTPNAPHAIASGDLNGDTFADLVVTLPGTSSISVLLGNGAGGFAVGPKIKVLGVQPLDVVVGDFNNDTMPDVATANYASANISFLQGNGAGGFAPATRFATGLRPTGLAIGDINNDGNIDLAVSHLVSRFVSVLFGNGAVAPATQFAPQLRVALPAFHAPNSIAIADFNGDGLADLGLGNSISTTFTILLGTGLGKFTQPYEFDLGRFPKSPKTAGIAIADLNNDGLLDVIATSPNTDDLRVLLRNV